MSILRLMLQTPKADHHNCRYKALDRYDGSQLHASARNDAIVIRGVHDVATRYIVETRKLEGKLDALVNTVTQLTANQKPASVARLDGKLDALVNLVTQLAANQKPSSIARVCGIRSSNDHHTSVWPSSQQSRVDDNPEDYAVNTYRGPPQQ
ncbi:hypothetical protein Fmac_028560 [Flemingia macrophylla]|uniref:Uncharacterized protein n=1 Tax=Flemingia macrophylla TaxID=520843 RepID=A0ABD1L7X8_9FABA